jgi:L-threonylcarbamoyladenylate synthase
VERFRITEAVRLLAAGAVVACPTEAVWGLSCDPGNEEAVMRLLDLKQRPVEKGLILVAADMLQFEWLLRGLNRADVSRLQLSWPGSTTWLVPHRARVPGWICGDFETVALRVTAHPTMAALCHAFGGPLVSTSANVAGRQPAREQFQVWRYFRGGLDGVVPGRLGGDERPTMIRDLESDTIVRPG